MDSDRPRHRTFSLIVFLSGGIRWIGLIGLVPLLTGIFNYCPIYSLLKISTNKDK